MTLNLNSSFAQNVTLKTTAIRMTRSAAAGSESAATLKLVAPTALADGAKTSKATASCAGSNRSDCTNTGTASGTYNQTTHNANNADLSAYAGTGQFAVSEVADLSATTKSNSYSSDANTTANLSWSGSLSTSFSYLLHAASSFNGASALNELTLDFGSVYRGSKVGDQAFSIYNMLDSALAGDRAGLALTSVVGSGNTARFSSGLALFDDLDAGAGANFKATFLTDTLGSFYASYKMTLGDARPDTAFASNTLGSGYWLTLNLKGNVIEQVGPAGTVPEPACAMLVGLGGVALLASRRRRKR